jgi:predicted nucleotidyltransferase
MLPETPPHQVRTQKVITDIVERLVADYQPQKIILFGSYAYGQPDADSDIDLLIIKDTPARLLDRVFAVRQIASDAHPLPSIHSF